MNSNSSPSTTGRPGEGPQTVEPSPELATVMRRTVGVIVALGLLAFIGFWIDILFVSNDPL